MRKVALTIAIISIYPVLLFAQTCLPEGINFTTQAQIDSFQINYPGCTEIGGDVLIGDYQSDITNLNGLSMLNAIDGSLTVYGTSLVTFEELNNLNFIGGYFSIGTVYNQIGIGNPLLQSLTGLENLTYIGESLGIQFNTSLTALAAIDGLSSIEGYLSIANNESLISLIGLEGVTSIEGDQVLHTGQIGK